MYTITKYVKLPYITEKYILDMDKISPVRNYLLIQYIEYLNNHNNCQSRDLSNFISKIS